MGITAVSLRIEESCVSRSMGESLCRRLWVSHSGEHWPQLLFCHTASPTREPDRAALVLAELRSCAQLPFTRLRRH